MKNYVVWFSISLLALGAGAMTVCAQTTAGQKRLAVDGVVEDVGGRLHVRLTNADAVREFRGAARVSIEVAEKQSEVARFEFKLAPQESRLFPLDLQGGGDHYTLSIYDRAGALVLLKDAPIKGAAGVAAMTPSAPAPPVSPASPAQDAATRLTVKARLVASQSGGSPAAAIKPPATESSTQTQEGKAGLVAVAPTPIAPADQQGQSQGSGPNFTVARPAPIAPTELPGTEPPAGPQAAPIKKPSARLARRGRSVAVKPPPPTERPASTPDAKIETPVNDHSASMTLVFDIASPTPIIDASFSVSADGLDKRVTVTIQGTASVEFELPDDFNAPKIKYTLTDASGRRIVTGELDFETLRADEKVWRE